MQQCMFAQTSKIIFEKSNIKGSIIKDFTSMNEIKSCRFDSVIFFINNTSINNQHQVSFFNYKTNKSGSIKINLKKKDNFYQERISSFLKFQNDFIFLTNKSIYLFKEKNGFLTLQNKIENTHNFSQILPLGEKIFLYVNYNYHPLDAKHQHAWAILNSENLTFDKFIVKENDNTKFSAFVNNWVDTYKSKLVYTKTLEYKIMFHDTDLNEIDSIVSNELYENIDNINFSIENSDFSKEYYTNLKKIDDSLLTRIRKIYFLNDTTVGVLLKIKNSHILRMDIWQKNSNEWIKVKSDSSTIWYEKGVEYSNKKTIYTDFYQNLYGFVYIGNYQFIKSYYPYIQSVDTKSFDENLDYFDKQNQTIKNEEIFIGFKTIQISFSNGQ